MCLKPSKEHKEYLQKLEPYQIHEGWLILALALGILLTAIFL